MPREGTNMNNKLKKSVSAALICAMMLTTTAAALNVTVYADNTSVTTAASKKKSVRVTAKNVKWYNRSKDNKFESPIYFVNGTDVPYIEVNDFAVLLYQFYVSNGNFDYDLDISADGDIVTIKRENGYCCKIDFANSTLTFDDYNEFVKLLSEQTLVDSHNLIFTDDDGKYLYMKTDRKASNERYGNEITMDLGAYKIYFIHHGDGYYLPLQTMNDVFFHNLSVNILYNGKSVFITDSAGGDLSSGSELTPLGKLYYKNKPEKFSKVLTNFNYCELCFVLDHFYGLKKRHNISSFNELFINTGLIGDLLSRKPEKIDAAIYRLITDYIDDQHSSFSLPGYASDPGITSELRKKYGLGISYENSAVTYMEFLKAREKFYPDGVPGYEEIGDTAFITFDSFSLDGLASGLDYYEALPKNDPTDTIGIVAYSVQQILREDSPIKNVVVDMSCNGGGSADTAFYTVAALLGKADICLEDTMTGAYVTTRYYADTNFDKKYNSKDHLAGKGLNLYCLTSDASFSCGNLVPSVLKQSSNASIIGQTSGGGACVVLPLCTASGTFFKTSGSMRISFVKNGSFYDVDEGAAVDYALSKKESFYDREKLVEYIDSLL